MTERTMRQQVEAIARVCHEANRGLCAASGDFSQPAWDDAPAWQRESAIAGVEHALANPGAKPSDSHESWLAQKVADGWTFGPVKDPAKKEHPCMVPYADLPPEQQAKDALFLSTVRALAPATVKYEAAGDAAQLDRAFTYHAPKADQPARYMALRATGRKLAEAYLGMVPPGRERALAMTNLEESIMWANAGIARGE